MKLSYKEKKQPCTNCGKKIVLGVNGCQLFDICFDCNNGYYSSARGSCFSQKSAFDDINTYDAPPLDFEYCND